MLVEDEWYAAGLSETAIGETDAVSFDELGRSRLMRICRHGHVLSIGAEFDHGV